MHRDPLTIALASALLLTIGVAAGGFLSRRTGVAGPFAVALGIRLVYGFVNYGLTRSLDNDGAAYDRDAMRIVAAWRGEGPPAELIAGKEGWSYILAAFYSILGHGPEVGVVLNCLAGSAVVIVVAGICRQLQWDRALRPAAWLVALWPVSFLWGPLLLREALVTLLLSVALLGAVLVRLGRWAGGLSVLLLSGVSLIWMRGGLAYLVLIGLPLLTALTTMWRTEDMPRSVRSMIAIAVGIAIVAPVALSALSNSTYFDMDQAAKTAVALDYGTTGFTSAGIGEQGAVMAFVYTALGPLPHQWVNIGLLSAGIDAVLWLVVWVFVVQGSRLDLPNSWFKLLSVAPSLALMAYVSASATNFGLIMRFRALALPLLAPLAAAGFSAWRDKRRSDSGPASSKSVGRVPAS